MIEFVFGVIGMVLLYFLGHLLYPDTKPKEIELEPWQLDLQRHEKNRKEEQEDE